MLMGLRGIDARPISPIQASGNKIRTSMAPMANTSCPEPFIFATDPLVESLSVADMDEDSTFDLFCTHPLCGQAPARVLGSVARPRNALTRTEVHGEGRILLAACNTKESAWDQPGTGHGLLSFGVIRAVTKAAGESVSFPEVAGEIVRLTRVEAERLTVTQTPIFLGHVQGGLTFPVLKRGDNFAAEFPAVAIHRISRSFTEFVNHGLPQEIVDQWQSHFPQGLNSLQLRAVNEHGVLDGESLLVVAPTSSGKTLIGEVAAIQAVTAGKRLHSSCRTVRWLARNSRTSGSATD